VFDLPINRVLNHNPILGIISVQKQHHMLWLSTVTQTISLVCHIMIFILLGDIHFARKEHYDYSQQTCKILLTLQTKIDRRLGSYTYTIRLWCPSKSPLYTQYYLL